MQKEFASPRAQGIDIANFCTRISENEKFDAPSLFFRFQAPFDYFTMLVVRADYCIYLNVMPPRTSDTSAIHPPRLYRAYTPL